MAQKDVQKLIQKMQGKKKKPVVKTVRTTALEGRKHFGHGGTNSMINQAQRDYNGSYFGGSSLGGVKVSNKSYDKYYGSQFIPKGFIK